MKTENVVLMKMARESLAGKWSLAVLVAVVYMVAMLVIQSVQYIGWVISLIVSGPISLGIAIFFLKISRGQEASFENVLEGFKNFQTALAAYLLITLYVFLWALLLIIPGIIAAYAYSMTFFILADDKSIGAKRAMEKSKQMMNGHKWKYFYLNVRFFGWALLSVLTFGIGFVWLMPYINVSIAKFYDDIKGEGSIIEENKITSESAPLQAA